VSRFEDYLRALPPAGGNGLHPRLLGAATVGLRDGLTPDDVFAALRANVVEAGRRVPDREIMQAIGRAARDAGTRTTRTGTTRRWTPARRIPMFDAARFITERLREGAGHGEADVWEASPVRIDWPPEADAGELLRRLYSPDDVLFCGGTYDTTVRSVRDWIATFESGAQIPPHIIPNPLTGTQATTADGKPTYRGDSCVRSFRVAVAEFDQLDREQQIAFWWSVALPVVALVDSGGKSLHAWIKVDGIGTADAWSREVEQGLFAKYLIPCGCDGACRNEARLSRLPGHFRAEKGRWQRVLYLAPEGRRIGQ
jgi:hypothetical protein